MRKIHVTNEGLLFPWKLTEHLGSDEVEVIEEPGRLVIVAGAEDAELQGTERVHPIPSLGRNPVHTGIRDGSTRHDAYLHDGDA